MFGIAMSYQTNTGLHEPWISLRLPGTIHSLSWISWWAHMLKSGSSRLTCLSMTWLKNDLNFAEIISPFPDGVDVALHIRWFWHGCNHGIIAWQPLSFEIFERTSCWKHYFFLNATNQNNGGCLLSRLSYVCQWMYVGQ